MRSTKVRNQIDCDLLGQHLLLRLRIEADMGRGETRDQFRIEQLPDTLAGQRSVIADDGEPCLLLPDELVEQTPRRADPHEAPDHDACACRDHRDGFFDGNGPHGPSSSRQRSRKRRWDARFAFILVP